MIRPPSSKVVFPCVHGSTMGELVTISCFRSQDLKGPIQMTSAIDGQSVKRIVGASRYHETDNRAAYGVIASLNNPLFSGQSYGLALALADKIARFGPAGKWTEIYATGTIPPDGCGAVGRINGLGKKIGLICSQGKPNSIFVFPSKNLDADIEKRLVLLKKKGIHFIHVHHIKELQGILWDEQTGKNETRNPLKKIRFNWQVIHIFFYRTAKAYSLQIYLIGGLMVLFVLFALLGSWRQDAETQKVSYEKQIDGKTKEGETAGPKMLPNEPPKPRVERKERSVLESEPVPKETF